MFERLWPALLGFVRPAHPHTTAAPALPPPLQCRRRLLSSERGRANEQWCLICRRAIVATTPCAARWPVFDSQRVVALVRASCDVLGSLCFEASNEVARKDLVS